MNASILFRTVAGVLALAAFVIERNEIRVDSVVTMQNEALISGADDLEALYCEIRADARQSEFAA